MHASAHLRSIGAAPDVPVGEDSTSTHASPGEQVTPLEPADIGAVGRSRRNEGSHVRSGLSMDGASAHADDGAARESATTVDGHGVLVERDNRLRVQFEALTKDELHGQIKSFLQRHFAGKTRSLSAVRQRAAETAAQILATVVTNSHGGFAEWARRLADKGKSNGPSRQWVATLGQPWGPRVAFGDLFLLPKSARVALWLALLTRETGTPDDDPGVLVRDTHRADHEADDTDFETLFDGVVSVDEAARLDEAHTLAGNRHLQVAAWARQIVEHGRPVAVRRGEEDRCRPHATT